MTAKEIKAILGEFKEFLNTKQKAAEFMQEFLYNDMTLDKYLFSLFRKLYFSPKLLGYNYLLHGIKIVMLCPRNMNGLLKVIYPSVAKEFKVSKSSVERAIRHVIEVGWQRAKFANDTIYKEIFNTNYKPTTSEFIASVVEKIRIEGINKAS